MLKCESSWQVHLCLQVVHHVYGTSMSASLQFGVKDVFLKKSGLRTNKKSS